MQKCIKVCMNIEETFKILLKSDEGHFHPKWYVNKQKFRHWTRHNPKALYESPLHDQKVTVWCGVSTCGVIGS